MKIQRLCCSLIYIGIASIINIATAQVVNDTTRCESLRNMKLVNGTVTTAQLIAAGSFKTTATESDGEQSAAQASAQATALAASLAKLPAFCRVAATLTPSSDSDIKIEVWLPIANWNGKLQEVGNGGWSGAIGYAALGRALMQGYATASTDTGHAGSRASFAMGHPEKLIDFTHRAVHEMTVQAKVIISTHYGNPAKYAYWNGCSSGGRQAQMSVQRYPNDFDGIIAGDAANNFIRQRAGTIGVAQIASVGAGYIPPEKYSMIHNAVIAVCDAIDGVKDGILENPMLCKFDPAVLECKGADAQSCLTAPQVKSAKAIYGGTKNPRTGEMVFPGSLPGSEMSWGIPAGPQGARTSQSDYFTYVVFKDEKWDWHTLDLDKDLALAEKMDGQSVATDPNLKPFFAHNGKLLMYHGWSDTNIAPENSINYYQSVVKAMGDTKITDDNIRLFMVPGMGHCAGGDGPNNFDAMAALTQWVEQGRTPEKIIASRINKGVVEKTRPLCPYPQVAKYSGTGSTDEAANFVCAKP